MYKNAVVRIQFPDSMILQGVFQPTNTIQDVNNFVKEHLKTPDKQFLICKFDLNYNNTYCIISKKTNFNYKKFAQCLVAVLFLIY